MKREHCMRNLRRTRLDKGLCDSNLDRLKLEYIYHINVSEPEDDDIDLPSVHFNDAIFSGSRVERVLDVAFPNNTQMPDDLESSTSKHVIFIIRQRLRRCNDNGIASVCSERVEVLHIAANDGVLQRYGVTITMDAYFHKKKTHICGIANNFILQLFPAFHATFDKYLRTQT